MYNNEHQQSTINNQQEKLQAFDAIPGNSMTYEQALAYTYNHGIKSDDRTGVGTIKVFSLHIRYNLSEGFPCITCRKINPLYSFVEMIWMIQGDTSLDFLHQYNCKFWDYNARTKSDGTFADNALGPVYGKQLRNREDKSGVSIDQIKNMIQLLKENPDTRRNVVSTRNPGENDAMVFPSCTFAFQRVVIGNTLNCQLFARAGDMFLGVPSDLIVYSALTHLVAHLCGYEVGEITYSIGDAHIYNNHIEQTKEVLSRKPIPLPTLEFNKNKSDIFEYLPEDFSLIDYNPHPYIKAELSA